jgi:hypothetical protein
MKQMKLIKVPRTFGIRFLTAALLVIGYWSLLIGNCSLAMAQVAIGSESVTEGALLDLSQGSGGLLLPRVQIDTISAGSPLLKPGMLVYNTGDNTVYTYTGSGDETGGEIVTAWAKGGASTASEIGLSNVDDTSDMDKPVSKATQDSLDLKANAADVYTQTNMDEFLALKANITDMNDSLALKAYITYVNEYLALKANITDMNDSLDLKE